MLALLTGLAATILIHSAPGIGTDERELNPHFSNETIATLRTRHVPDSILNSYRKYLAGAIRGDLGTSTTFDRPVSDLLAERGPVTARLVGSGLVAGWGAGLLL